MLTLHHPRLWFAGALLLVLLVVVGSLSPGEYVGSATFWRNDKVNHALGYAALTFWFTGLYPRSRYPLIVLGLLLLGAGIEVLQGAMSFGREREFADFLANGAGIAAGLLLAITWSGGWAQKVEARIHRLRDR